jgi:hypothetical protein
VENGVNRVLSGQALVQFTSLDGTLGLAFIDSLKMHIENIAQVLQRAKTYLYAPGNMKMFIARMKSKKVFA